MSSFIADHRQLELPERRIKLEVYRPVNKQAAPGILLLHELYGLLDWYREDAADLARRGYLVYVPDLYTDGARRYCIRAMVHSAGRNNHADSPLNLEVHALLDALKSDPGCNGRMGMLGACLTGGFVLQMAKRTDMLAPVVYHHSLGLQGSGVPERESLDSVRKLQGHWSRIDPFCPAKRRQQLIDTLGDRLEAHLYNMPHGFRSISRGLPGSKIVWDRTLAFFDRELRSN
jgi:carboxymethylenebutenolidase